ncbi:unnamed protein product [Dibothriocephalus latus]|uniref:Uncharacterized protein n=1 Tax=Dibothriocephalus latus TaxID=60516 RepID=A0A3P7PK29_DIBLA|nr:unnamed protein product [Dibothriocephalus latus]
MIMAVVMMLIMMTSILIAAGGNNKDEGARDYNDGDGTLNEEEEEEEDGSSCGICNNSDDDDDYLNPIKELKSECRGGEKKDLGVQSGSLGVFRLPGIRRLVQANISQSGLAFVPPTRPQLKVSRRELMLAR